MLLSFFLSLPLFVLRTLNLLIPEVDTLLSTVIMLHIRPLEIIYFLMECLCVCWMLTSLYTITLFSPHKNHIR